MREKLLNQLNWNYHVSFHFINNLSRQYVFRERIVTKNYIEALNIGSIPPLKEPKRDFHESKIKDDSRKKSKKDRKKKGKKRHSSSSESSSDSSSESSENSSSSTGMIFH